jgi:hypothetical protein
MEWHPLAREFPIMEGAEWDAFKNSIARTRGVLQAITYRVVKGVKQGLDGRQRELACEQLGIAPRYEKLIMADDEVEEYIIAKNVLRRHMTMELRLKLVEILRGKSRSIRQIAGMLGVSIMTVERDLDKLDDAPGVTPVTPEPNPDKGASQSQAPADSSETAPEPTPTPTEPTRTIGTDGKSYPAKKVILCAGCQVAAPGTGVPGCKACAKARKEAKGSSGGNGEALASWKDWDRAYGTLVRLADGFKGRQLKGKSYNQVCASLEALGQVTRQIRDGADKGK